MTTELPIYSTPAVGNKPFEKVWFDFFEAVWRKIFGSAAGILQANFDDKGNIGSSPTELYKYTITGGTLRTNSDYIEFCVFGIYAANDNNKEISLKLGATTIFSIAATPINDKSFEIKGKICKQDTVTKVITTGNGADPTTVNTTYLDTSEDLSTNLDFLLSATGVSTDDVVKKGAVVKLYLSN